MAELKNDTREETRDGSRDELRTTRSKDAARGLLASLTTSSFLLLVRPGAPSSVPFS